MDEVTGSIQFAVESREVAGNLVHPFLFRMLGDSTHDNTAGTDLDEEQDVERAQPRPGPDLGGYGSPL